jgi:predicted nucleic acid-binding protein
MNGNKAILDSNVIIFASKRIIDVAALLARYDHFYVSVITFMEVYGYEFDITQEKEAIDTLFKHLEIVHSNDAVMRQVVIYRKNKSKKIKLPDAIILATAKYLDADLLSDDWDDFRGIDKAVRVLNVDDLKI